MYILITLSQSKRYNACGILLSSYNSMDMELWLTWNVINKLNYILLVSFNIEMNAYICSPSTSSSSSSCQRRKIK